jgi:hypothetical protein
MPSGDSPALSLVRISRRSAKAISDPWMSSVWFQQQGANNLPSILSAPGTRSLRIPETCRSAARSWSSARTWAGKHSSPRISQYCRQFALARRIHVACITRCTLPRVPAGCMSPDANRQSSRPFDASTASDPGVTSVLLALVPFISLTSLGPQTALRQYRR